MATLTNRQALILRALIALGFLSSVWILICAGWQFGWGGIGGAMVLILILASLGALAWIVVRFHWAEWIPIAVAGLIALAWFIVNQRYLWDGFVFVLALVLSLFFTRETRTWVRSGRYLKPPAVRPISRAGLAAVTLLVFWLLSSLLLLANPADGLPADARRFARASAQQARVGLALSGGGYRAAVVHAGVLDALEALNVRVDYLSTVSGGSIVGAYYAMGGYPTQFAAAVGRRMFNLRRELLAAHNLFRLPFPARVPFTDLKLLPGYEFGTIHVQAAVLDRLLYRRETIQGATRPDRPRLLICTTDLSRGIGIGIHPAGFVMRTLQAPGQRWPFVNTKPASHGAEPTLRSTRRAPEDVPLALLVAASGAFPAAFDAIDLTLIRPTADGKRGALAVTLADGGIVDNSGVALLSAKAHGDDPSEPPWKMDLIIASDASAAFLPIVDFVITPLEQPLRAVEIMYANGGHGARMDDTSSPPIHLLSPQALIVENQSNDSLIEDVVSRVRGSPASKILPVVGLDPQLDSKIIKQALASFDTVKTLADNLSATDAERLLTLGRFLVAMNWPDLCRALGRADCP